jgi:hypothetical protein
MIEMVLAIVGGVVLSVISCCAMFWFLFLRNAPLP